MIETILVPQVGQDLTEAKVIALHVKVGDRVKRGDIVAEVESEKATFEVEAFATGVVTSLPYKVGDFATVLEPLVILENASEAKPATAANGTRDAAPQLKLAEKGQKTLNEPPRAGLTPANGSVRSSPLARRIAQSHGLDIAKIVGTGSHGAVVVRDVEEAVTNPGGQALIIQHIAGTAGAQIGQSVPRQHGHQSLAKRAVAMGLDPCHPLAGGQIEHDLK